MSVVRDVVVSARCVASAPDVIVSAPGYDLAATAYPDGDLLAWDTCPTERPLTYPS